jgi:hypothetical protein
MGFTGAPDPAAVRGARSRFLEGAGADPAAAAAVRQVHGARVLAAGPAERGRGGLDPGGSLGEADGILTAEAGLPLLVLSADCVVAALATSDGRALSVFHAGWRGAAAGIAGAAVAALAERSGAPPGAMRAVLGPAIGPCCYEVGEEVAAAFPGFLRPGRGERPHLDLPGAVRGALAAAGVPEGAVAGAGECTLCGRGWFSHRRGDGGRQMLAAWRMTGTEPGSLSSARSRIPPAGGNGTPARPLS